MTMKPAVTRRTALVAGAATLGGATLAACSSDSSSTTSAPPSAPPSTSAGTSPAGGKGLVALNSIKVGEAVSAKLADGSKVIVARPTSTTAVAFSAICTHQGCTVAPAGKKLDCPCHGSVYNATTGAVMSGPAPKPLPKVPVHVAGGQVIADQ